MSTGAILEVLPSSLCAIRTTAHALDWLEIQQNLQAPRNTLVSYAYDLEDFLVYCSAKKYRISDVAFKDIATYINDLANRPLSDEKNKRNRRGQVGLARSTIRRRISTIRQFYDYLWGEGACDHNPARRSSLHGRRRALVREPENLPWIPNEEEWSRLVDAVLTLNLRNRTMFALNYDTGMRKEELCGLWLRDFDHAYRTVTVRSENTKNRRTRIVAYGKTTNALVVKYLATLPKTISSREPIFRSCSKRNFGEPITVHTWTKVVEGIALTASVPEFHPHSLRHLCLTDLARSGWDIREIRDFAGHKRIRTTEKYIHLSGREILEKFRVTMTQVHSQRTAMLAMVLGGIP